MSYTCDRCQRELFGPASWNAHINPEQHVEAQHRENEGLDSSVSLGYSYDATLGDLQISRGNGCFFCDLLLARINQLSEGWQATDLLDEHPEGFVWFAIGAFALPGISEDFFAHGPAEKDINFYALIAKGWLRNCLSNHQQCQVTRSRVLPSRALCLSHRDASIHIELEMNPPDNIQFVFPSYRWGDQKLKLTQKSVNELIRGIPLSSLPATLKDAVQVTHELDIPYLWIDALCIFQDSTDDLAKEIANMEVYIQQAVLVLQPSLVKSVHDPFLYNHAPRQRTDIEPRRKITLEVQSTGRQPYSIVLDPNAPWYQPNKEPVNSRAWIMQERLLCPRVLILPSIGGIVWQCEAHERIHGRIHYAYAVEEDHGCIALAWRPWDLSPQLPLTAKEIHNAWLIQVDDYNKRDLTNPQDKLLPISALAKRFRDNYGDVLGEYCAGSWYNFFNANVNNSMYLSKGQPIMHPHLRTDVISCEIDLLSQSFPWGSVTGGKLSLKGVILQVYWDVDDSLFEQFQGTHSTQEDSQQVHISFVEFYFNQDDFRGESNHGLLLPVTDTGGVLLRRNDTRGTYRRIGYCVLGYYNQFHDIWQSRWPRLVVIE
ncbi:hypothetical protein GGR58DRAFT_501713 [Xylaria digitata]|nr:hypothetical protein GGR58DRAFT_501713 [Xylaria digitata]